MRHVPYLASPVCMMIVENHALCDIEAHPLQRAPERFGISQAAKCPDSGQRQLRNLPSGGRFHPVLREGAGMKDRGPRIVAAYSGPDVERSTAAFAACDNNDLGSR